MARERPSYADYFALDRLWRMELFYAKFGCGESEMFDTLGVS